MKIFKKFLEKKDFSNLNEEWFSFLRNTEKGFFLIRINRSFKNIFPIKGLNFLVEFSLVLNQNKYFIDKIEDKLHFNLQKESLHFFVGVEEKLKKINFYFYSKNVENLYDILRKIMLEFREYDFSLSNQKDKNWKKYEKLLPIKYEFERSLNGLKFLNIQKKQNLENNEIFYILSFKSEEIFSYTKKELKDFGFKITGKGKGKRKIYKYAVKLTKSMEIINIKEINKNTLFLCNLADKYNFVYEGLIFKEKNNFLPGLL